MFSAGDIYEDARSDRREAISRWRGLGGDAGMKVKADTKTRLLEHIRIAEKMADAIYQLSSGKGEIDGQAKQTLIYWSVRAKAALRDAKATVEGELDGSTSAPAGQDEP
jgi:hypothetical protein